MRKANYIYYSYANELYSIIWLYPDGELTFAILKDNSEFYISEEQCKEKDLLQEVHPGTYEIRKQELYLIIEDYKDFWYSPESSDIVNFDLLDRYLNYHIKSRTFNYSSSLSSFPEKLELRRDSLKYSTKLDDAIFHLYWTGNIKFSKDTYVDLVRPIRFNNQNELYPIVLLPLGIHSAIYTEVSEEEAIKALKIKPPELVLIPFPERPLQYGYMEIRGNILVLIVEICCIVLIILAVVNNYKTINYPVVLSMLFIFLFLFFRSIRNKKRIRVKMKFAKAYYGHLLQQYELECHRIGIDNDKLKEEYNEKTKEFRIKYGQAISDKRRSMFGAKGISPSDLTICQERQVLRRGKTELTFLKELHEIFGSSVVVDSNLLESSYMPDFIIKSEHFKFFIDVEIDEPYTNSIDEFGNKEEGIPIHYLNGPDDIRNDFFLNNGWVVIRFSEKQIATQAKLCAYLVENVFNSIENGWHTYGLTVERHMRWTYEEALLMYKDRIRSKW